MKKSDYAGQKDMISRLITLKKEFLDIFCYFRVTISWWRWRSYFGSVLALYYFASLRVHVRFMYLNVSVNACVSRQQKFILCCLPEITVDKKISSAAPWRSEMNHVNDLIDKC